MYDPDVLPDASHFEAMAQEPAEWSRISAVLRRDKLTLVGVVILSVFVLAAAFGPLFTPHPPNSLDFAAQLVPPSASHLFGTDNVGRDIFSRVLVATRIDLLLALGAVATALAIGSLVGMVAGYTGGWPDEVLMRTMDVIQSFPAFVLALGVVAVLGQGVGNILAAIAFINIPSYARLMRTQFLSARERQYAEAARVVGDSHLRIIWRHLLPNCMAPVLVIASLNVGWAILTTAGLSFLGIGVRPPTAEWGQMIASGTEDLATGVWWTSMFPGLALFIVVLGANLLGDGLRDILDPRS